MSMPGKIETIPTAELSVDLRIGHMIDRCNWVEHLHQCTVRLSLNNSEIYYGAPAGVVNYRFVDSKESTEYVLQIELLNIEAPFRVNNQWAAPMLQIHSIKIEGLSMRQVIENHGRCKFYNDSKESIPSEFMGQPGYQTLTFTTPIYRWLLDHHAKPDYYY